MLRLLPAVLLALLFGCNGGLPPGPEPTPPTPPPEPWECSLEMPGCHETDPPQQCSSEASPCWHNPSDNPEHCEEAPSCAKPPPDPPQPQCPTFTDRGGTIRTLADEPCGCWFGQVWAGNCPCAEEADLVGVACPTPGADFQDEVKEATDILGDLRGRPPNENLDKLAEQLRLQLPNRCILSGIEAVFILRDDGTDEAPVYEENHAVFFGNGGWTNSGRGAFIGCHRDVGGECVDPDPTGLEARLKGKKHHQDVDTVYQVKSFNYCTEAGFTNRTWCPLRNEGDREREACEEQEIGAQQWWCDGVKLDPCAEGVNEDACVRENRAQARCHGYSKFCTEDGATCGTFDW